MKVYPLFNALARGLLPPVHGVYVHLIPHACQALGNLVEALLLTPFHVPVHAVADKHDFTRGVYLCFRWPPREVFEEHPQDSQPIPNWMQMGRASSGMVAYWY